MRLAPLLALLATPALGGAADGTCDTALVFAIDVSNSVVPVEYRLQVDGLADALRHPEVMEALIEGQVALSVLQWSGETAQLVSVPWRVMRGPADALNLSATVRGIERAYLLSDTAPAQAVEAALALLAEAPPCARHVIDVSGDGRRNAGGDVPAARDLAESLGATINAIAIEITGTGVAAYFRADLITRDGFVMAARGHDDYPRAIREKILRELADPTS